MLFYLDSFLQILGSTFLDLFLDHLSKGVSRILIPVSVDYWPLEEVFRSENFVVLAKPPDVDEVTLWAALQAQVGNAADRETQRAVFRQCFQADAGFSGLYPVGLHKRASQGLKSRRVHTYHVAIVRGLMEQAEIRIDAPIGRDLRFRSPVVRMCTSTDWEHCYSPCECTTQVILVETGYFDEEFSSKVVVKSYRGDRKHQFRVHLKEVGHPLVGDTLYDDVGHPRSDHLMIRLLRVRVDTDVESLQVDSGDPFTVARLCGRWRVKETFSSLSDALEKLDSLEAF
ncbi:RNA pseudouridylate synthase domain-containing protein 1-like [Phlebotomus argentipes]|uniref:RNA pseudouridylate synthase domain-containing protein 1-like n=1 Tax=Phlebotomus argentipes TaxID=94469 RepID=UPI0028935282|nr:RNA pseudouridylate synthase domain-containing protein 1-like [Phlebotomus argentipes]